MPQQKIIIPDIGDYKDVPVISIGVKVGDEIAAEDTVIVLETDKATMDIPSPYEGKITEIMVKIGDKVSKGSVIAMIEAEKIDKPIAAEEPKQTPQTETPRAAVMAAEKPRDTTINAGPGVRRFARILGINLAQIAGTGHNGRIVQDDLANFIKNNNFNSGGGLNIEPWPKVDFAKFGSVDIRELSKIQKLSGKFLHRNWVSIPHVTQFDEADVTELEKFRASQKQIAEQKGVKLTILGFIMQALCKTLEQPKFRHFNASLDVDKNNLIIKNYYNFGVAVDTENGLVVPVVRDVNKKGIWDLSLELKNLSEKARDNNLKAPDMQGGTFSISSLGGIGGTYFTPIINAPEVAILGVSKIAKREGKLYLPLSLSYDHRVIDGADAARFTSFLSNCLAILDQIRM